MAIYGGQNAGARKLDRIRQGLKCCVVLGAVYSVIALIVLYFFSDTAALLFVKAKEIQILRNTRLYLLINGLFYFPLALVNIIRFLIQGLGYSKLAIVAGVCEMAARAFVGFLMVPVFGYLAVCFASPIAWVAADLFLIPGYRHIMKRLDLKFQSQQAVFDKNLSASLDSQGN